MSFYDNRILPTLINVACGSKPTRKQREKIVPRAYGDVLEVGFGGGLNLPHYDQNNVRRVFGLEPSEGMRRSNGHLFFCEHGKAPDQDVHKWQRRLNGGWRRFSGGCNMDRDIPALLREGGFDIEDDNRMYIPGIRALSYNFWGAAR